jgi:hypothetical protein
MTERLILGNMERGDEGAGRLADALWSRIIRNYLYKPLLHCRLV